MWFKRHLLALLSAPVLIPGGFKSVWHSIGHAGNLDFLLSHIRDWQWARDMLTWFLELPPWTVWPMFAAGLVLIWLDFLRWKTRAKAASASGGSTDNPLGRGQERVEHEQGRTANQTVTSHGQSGGITALHVGDRVDKQR